MAMLTANSARMSVAADDFVPPSPTKSSDIKQTSGIFPHRQRVYCPPAVPYCPPPTPVPSVIPEDAPPPEKSTQEKVTESPSTNTGGMNQPQGQQQNTAPNLTTSSTASSAPAFIGDFINSGGSKLSAPGSVLEKPAGATNNWTPLAYQLVDSHGNAYYRNVDIIPTQIGPNVVNVPFANAFAFARNGAYQQDSAYLINSNTTIGYQAGLSMYNGAAYNGDGSTLPGPVVAGQNIAMVASLPHGANGNSTGVFSIGAPASLDVGGGGHTTQEILYIHDTSTNTDFIVFRATPAPNFSVDPTKFSTGQAGMYAVRDGANHFVMPAYLATNAVGINVVSPSLGAGGIQKLVENASPIPRDRVFLGYNYFQGAQLGLPNGGTANVNRLTPGFEKTFLNQRASVEFRVPFATTVDNVNLSGLSNTGSIQLGNVTAYMKALLYTDSVNSWTTGLGVQMPTANGTTMNTTLVGRDINGNADPRTWTVATIGNEAVHIMPYLGYVYTPNDRFYAQSVMQFDVCTNGNPVSTAAVYPVTTFDPTTGQLNGFTTGATPLTRTGMLQDTNFMYLSANAGYWIYKVRNPYETGLTGIAPTVEVHYNQSLQKGDVVAGPYGNMASPVSGVSNVNGVVGVNTIIGHDKYLTAAYVAPFTNGVNNKFFDGELRVMFNYYFGGSLANARFANVPGQ